MATNINDYLDRIERMSSIHSVTLDDYPSLNSIPQIIAEKVESIACSLEKFNGYVNNNQQKSIWSLKINDSDTFLNEIKEWELNHPIKTKGGGEAKKIGDFEDSQKEAANDEEKCNFENLKIKYKNCKEILNNSFAFFKDVWVSLQSSKEIDFKIDNPTINQIRNWTYILPSALPQNELKNILPWDALYKKIESCFYPPKKGLSFNKPFWFSRKRWENEEKIREKMMNAIIDAFKEDREYARLRTKTEIALHEKMEKARIDEWCRNKEHLRKLNIMEQERRNEYADTLKELAKTKNTVTIKGLDDRGKIITIETSILSDNCCDKMMGVLEKAVKP